jgi:integrase
VIGCPEGKVSKSTMEEYKKDMNNQVLPKFGNIPISSISSLDIENFICKLNCSGKRKNNILTPFRDVVKFAKKHKFITDNPMLNVDRIEEAASDKNPLSLDEIKIFLVKSRFSLKPYQFITSHCLCFCFFRVLDLVMRQL